MADGCALPEWSVPLWVHLQLWEIVFLVCVAALNHTHPLPCTPFLGRLQEALEVEKAPESWQRRVWARLVIHLYSGVGEVQTPVSEPQDVLGGPADGIGSAAQGGIFLPSILVPDSC